MKIPMMNTVDAPVKHPKFGDFMKAVLQPIDLEKKPDSYAVVLHNDDYTMPGFVVEILNSIFCLPMQLARNVMMGAHMNGKVDVAIYSESEAQRLMDAVAVATQNTHLVFTMEKRDA